MTARARAARGLWRTSRGVSRVSGGSIRLDARELLSVVAVALAGLLLAALAAFTPWYNPGDRGPSVVELEAPTAVHVVPKVPAAHG